jgi:hypothetical protein
MDEIEIETNPTVLNTKTLAAKFKRIIPVTLPTTESTTTTMPTDTTEDDSCCLMLRKRIQKRKRKRKIKKLDYKNNLYAIVDGLQLSEIKQEQISRRFIEVADESRKLSKSNKNLGSQLDLVTLWGGIVVSGLIIVQHSEQISDLGAENLIFWILVIFSIVVNIATGTQQVYDLSHRATIHEKTFHEMDSEGWLFFTLSGEYSDMTHENAYSTFSQKIETIRQRQQKQLTNLKHKNNDDPKT